MHAVDGGLVSKLLITVAVYPGEGAERNAGAPRCDRRDLESKGQVIDGAQGRPVADILPAWGKLRSQVERVLVGDAREIAFVRVIILAIGERVGSQELKSFPAL